jgi:hypothetical protein
MPNPLSDLEITPKKALKLAAACNHLADQIEAFVPIEGSDRPIPYFGLVLAYKAVWAVERIINPRFETFYQYTDRGRVTGLPNDDRGLCSGGDNRTVFALDDPLWILSHNIKRDCLNPILQTMGWESLCSQRFEPDYRRDFGLTSVKELEPLPSEILFNLRLYARLLEVAANQSMEPLWPSELLAIVPEFGGKQRRTLELVLEANGRIPLSSLAKAKGVNWEIPYEKSWESAQREINKRLNAIGWRLVRRDGDAKLEQIDSPQK